MAGTNLVVINGRIGNTPEIKQAASGTTIINFSVATSSKIKGSEKTEWHSMVAFGKVADLISQYVKKGDKHCFTGHLQTNSWEKDGKKNYRTQIIVDSIDFGDNKHSGGGSTQQHESPENNDISSDGDLPF